MKFSPLLQAAHLERRYKRFLADVKLENGDIITIHCPNTGSMKNCMWQGAPIWFSTSNNPGRRYPNTWELTTTPSGDLAGINTSRANALVREALTAGLLPQLGQFNHLRAEVNVGEGSRCDFLLESDHQKIFIEVKNVTLCEDDGLGYFPDAVSERGARHLGELVKLKKVGHRAALIYCVQHSGIRAIAPAAHIDKKYTEAFAAACDAGVEVYALGACLSPEEIVLNRVLDVVKNSDQSLI
jgi:sugar fermentation stimulation protein A